MKLQEFEELPQSRQCDTLYKRGVYIGKTRRGQYTRVLYNLDGYYVEVIYRKYRLIIQSITAFESVDKLDPYLAQIDIEDFVSF